MLGRDTRCGARALLLLATALSALAFGACTGLERGAAKDAEQDGTDARAEQDQTQAGGDTGGGPGGDADDPTTDTVPGDTGPRDTGPRDTGPRDLVFPPDASVVDTADDVPVVDVADDASVDHDVCDVPIADGFDDVLGDHDVCDEPVADGVDVVEPLCVEHPVCCAGGIPADDEMPCDDADACTLDDVCTAGVCGGEPFVCPDRPVCANKEFCDGEGGCTFELRNRWCLIDGVCHERSARHPNDPCLGCDDTANAYEWTAFPDCPAR